MKTACLSDDGLLNSDWTTLSFYQTSRVQSAPCNESYYCSENTLSLEYSKLGHNSYRALGIHVQISKSLCLMTISIFSVSCTVDKCGNPQVTIEWSNECQVCCLFTLPDRVFEERVVCTGCIYIASLVARPHMKYERQ